MADHELDYDDHEQDHGCYVFDFEKDNDSHENSDSISDDDSHTEDNHGTEVADENPKTPATQEEIPQTSSEDTVLILQELRKLNATVECLSNRLSNTEKNLSSLKKKMGKGKDKKTKKVAVDVPIEVRVSSYSIAA